MVINKMQKPYNKYYIMCIVSIALNIMTWSQYTYPSRSLLRIIDQEFTIQKEQLLVIKGYSFLEEDLPKCNLISPSPNWICGYGKTLIYEDTNGQTKACKIEKKISSFFTLSTDNTWTTGNGEIERWNGETWHSIPTPVFNQPKWLGELDTNDLYDSYFLSKEKGWIVGGIEGNSGDNRFSSKQTWQRLFFEWDGKNWNFIQPPGIDMSWLPLKSIVMFSDRNGWLAGSGNQLYHWNGSDWLDYMDKNQKNWMRLD